MNNQDCQPSAFGFRNIQPKTRQERRGHYDKVSLEKSRIDQRVGFEARIHQANAPKHSSQLTSCLSEGAGYISNADRFHCDTAGEEYATRQDAIQRKNRAIEFRRNQASIFVTNLLGASDLISHPSTHRVSLERRTDGSKWKRRESQTMSMREDLEMMDQLARRTHQMLHTIY